MAARASGASAKAPATAFARARAPSPRSTGVALVRRRRSGAKGTPCARESDAAINPAWLNPRDHSRQRCSGTGTSSSASPGISRAIARAMVAAQASLPEYLSLSATPLATSP